MRGKGWEEERKKGLGREVEERERERRVGGVEGGMVREGERGEGEYPRMKNVCSGGSSIIHLFPSCPSTPPSPHFFLPNPACFSFPPAFLIRHYYCLE